eukprot:763792-Hanusia_phi.AAC.7
MGRPCRPVSLSCPQSRLPEGGETPPCRRWPCSCRGQQRLQEQDDYHLQARLLGCIEHDR